MPGALRTAFSLDGKRLAIAGLDTDVGVVMDVQSGKEIFSKEHGDHVQKMDWSPDGRWITTPGLGGVAVVGSCESLALDQFAASRWYVVMITPLVVTALSTSSKWSTGPLSSKRRRP